MADKLFRVAELVELGPVDELVYLTRKISPVASEEIYNRPWVSKASPTGLLISENIEYIYLVHPFGQLLSPASTF